MLALSGAERRKNLISTTSVPDFGGTLNVILNHENIETEGDILKQFGIGAAMSILTYASAGGAAAFNPMSKTFSSAAEAGFTKAMFNQAAKFAWDVTYEKTGASDWVTDELGYDGVYVDAIAKMFGPAVFEAQLSSWDGLADGVKEVKNLNKDDYFWDTLEESKNANRNIMINRYNEKINCGGRTFETLLDDGCPVTKVTFSNGKTIYYAYDKANILGDHVNVAIKNPKLNDFAQRGHYATRGLCHQSAIRAINRANGTHYLPSQVFSGIKGQYFYQSLYGAGELPGSGVFHLIHNYYYDEKEC
jgi:hypothetical protein